MARKLFVLSIAILLGICVFLTCSSQPTVDTKSGTGDSEDDDASQHSDDDGGDDTGDDASDDADDDAWDDDADDDAADDDVVDDDADDDVWDDDATDDDADDDSSVNCAEVVQTFSDACHNYPYDQLYPVVCEQNQNPECLAYCWDTLGDCYHAMNCYYNGDCPH